MNNPVVVVLYKRLEYLPPVMSLLQVVRQIGRKVFFVGVWSEAGERFLKENNIDHEFLPYKYILYQNNSLFSKITHRVERGFGFFRRRKALSAVIHRIAEAYGKPTLWFADTQSAALLGNEVFKYKSAVTIFELAENGGYNWWGFDFKHYMATATVVVPEYNRAYILKEHYHLKRLPCVVANKPAFHPRSAKGVLPEGVENVFEKIGTRPVFLYQGVWTNDRKDVGFVLSTIAKNRPNYCVAMMPGNSAAEELLSQYKNAFSIPYIAPPNHLYVTARATVGVAVYNVSGTTLLNRLNDVYCAPNKIYEYAGFGIPTLGNNIPGLKYTIEAAKAGVCCEMTREGILAAADQLVENIDQYRQCAKRFFDETDLNAQIKEVLKVTEET